MRGLTFDIGPLTDFSITAMRKRPNRSGLGGTGDISLKPMDIIEINRLLPWRPAA
jgi:hypothetical protein